MSNFISFCLFKNVHTSVQSTYHRLFDGALNVLRVEKFGACLVGECEEFGFVVGVFRHHMVISKEN
jgi:hypothetical protein